MAADPRFATLARIADLRERRLTRAASDAHQAAEAARQAAECAEAERAAATAARDDARRTLMATPACAQARLWLDHSRAGEMRAAVQLSDRHSQLDQARDAHGAAVGALARHQIRTEVIGNHHRSVQRAAGRRAEDRLEADTPAQPRARIA